jgi:uncharacterized radical SAM superfamily Fe-S cluster-containing enzyme
MAKAYRVCPKCGDRVEAGIIADDGIVFWNTGETGEINSEGRYVHFGMSPHEYT